MLIIVIDFLKLNILIFIRDTIHLVMYISDVFSINCLLFFECVIDFFNCNFKYFMNE